MTCRKCGKELPQDASFCPYCGAEAELEVSSLEEAAASPVPEDLDESSAAIPETRQPLRSRKRIRRTV